MTMPLQLPQPGWYEVPGRGEIRWRDETHWTPYRIRKGTAGADWYATEPPLVGYAFGAIFVMIGLMQSVLAVLSHSLAVNAILMFLLAIFWFSSAIATSAVRRLPLPVSAALALDLVEPLPGRVEGPGAGWYQVSSRSSRWWSGQRWGHYVSTAGRIRPTFTGPKLYRGLLITGFVLLGIGALGLVVGVVMLAIGASWDLPWIGLLPLLLGIALAIIGGIIFPVAQVRKPTLLLPEHPPRI